MRFSALLVVTALVMASSTLSARQPREVANRPSPRTVDYEWMSVATWNQKHEANVARAAQGNVDVLLLGDSITEGWNNTEIWKEHYPKLQIANFGIGGDTTANLLWRLENGEIGNLRPRLIVLMIGINNLGRNGDKPAEVVTGIQTIVSILHSRIPACKILVLGLLPADEKPRTRLRKQIADTNRRLAENLHDGHSILVEDYSSVMLEPDGTISPEIMADFLHPTPAGYKRLADAMFPRMERYVFSTVYR
ncbi:MAG: mucin-desulfating sulfatase [Opitutaceae bacterium]|nr:mucin-desulfating sulfatase [Opitutaceae bacterium]